MVGVSLYWVLPSPLFLGRAERRVVAMAEDEDVARVIVSLAQLVKALKAGTAHVESYSEEDRIVRIKVQYPGRAVVHILVNLE